MIEEALQTLQQQLAEDPSNEELEKEILRELMKTYGYKTMVKTVDPLHETDGFLVADRHIQARAAGRWGLLSSYAPGHGGDVWFIGHADSSVGAYAIDELVINEEALICDE